MTERFEISRRKALAALGTIGVASAGAGLGTSALFTDEESFENNNLVAGSLDLFVDYWTSSNQGSYGSSVSSGQVDGERGATYAYELSDVKPGDSGALAFCPKIVDNPAWLWLGSGGVVDYENGQTEPEMDADASGGGSISSPNNGAGFGELSESIQVTISYAEGITPIEEDGDLVGFECVDPVALNNPEDYTLADLSDELLFGFLMDVERGEAGPQPYPGSPDVETQTGPCLCIEWELPIEVGNEIQTDALDFDFTFVAEQSRHNGSPMSPFVDVDASSTVVTQPADAQAGYPGSFTLRANENVVEVDLSGLAESFPADTAGSDNVGVFLGDAGGNYQVEVKLEADGTFVLANNNAGASIGDFSPMLDGDVIRMDTAGFGSVGVIANIVDGNASTTQAVATPGDDKPWQGPLYVI
ncbi:SipW-dependent-type signal peptide-containing protein [Halobellus inordinatus]|uniref:SipW-dependent-type signal peptide-containing protein n=1 Tax=Halobellus inordinatus TaxID=1126236 RepID=UPI002113A5DA|nr:SipW-dependent-type signal peptide-containing protein [Halobellus ramosii]